MKPQIITFITLLCGAFLLNAQVGINNTNPQAQLDVSSPNQADPSAKDGILIPRIDKFPTTDPDSSQHSMLVYLTTTDNSDTPGFYYWSDTDSKWLPLQNVKRINDLLDGKSDFDGSQNGSSIFLGIDAGGNDDGTNNKNIGIGFEALKNSNSSSNVAVGFRSLKNNTTGTSNVAIGRRSMIVNSTGVSNVGVGDNVLSTNTTGSFNVGIGRNALLKNSTGNYNIGVGSGAMSSASAGSFNVGVGTGALRTNRGSKNSGFGNSALSRNTTGVRNTAVGSGALSRNKTGSNNVAVGEQALLRSENNNNVAVGRNTLSSLTSGRRNVAIGHASLESNVTGVNNIAIGYQADRYYMGSNQVTLGNGNNNSYRMFAAGWTTPSDKRLKNSIKSLPIGLNLIKKLNPVEYIYNNSEKGNKTYGFVAQEFKQALIDLGVNEEVIVVDFDGTHLGMHQIEIIPVLTKAIQEQQDEIESLKQKIKDIEKMLETLKEK